MKKLLFIVFFMLIASACQQKENPVIFKIYDETVELEAQQNHEKKRMQFKLIQSKYLDMNEVFKPFQEDLAYFSEENYQELKPLILEQDIPTLQKSIKEGNLTYEKLTLFYLYRIRKFESDRTKSLHAIIALNPNVVKEARARDKNRKSGFLSELSIYGMPILLKDNINTKEMPTTAGAIALQRNFTKSDAFIVERLKENGALILGKVNLSEWAYFFCSACPLGYSAIGGQTLNPYGRKVFETGGSSSGSAVAIAANYAVAAVGTETSGSITSPASLNSVVGLKPTIGSLSRTGIVPISSTLDTPGPMTKNVTDNLLMLIYMIGKDELDPASLQLEEDAFFDDYDTSLSGKKMGVLKPLLSDSIYAATIKKIKRGGAEVIEIIPPEISYQGFRTLLNIDMKYDLPKYLKNNADTSLYIKNVKDVIAFNRKDSLLRAPYGQQLLEGILKDSTKLQEFKMLKMELLTNGLDFFKIMAYKNLDAVLSINNFHSGVAAIAEHPTLTIPMGYKKSGEPVSLTFIGIPFFEIKLLEIGYAFEQLTKVRKMPKNYQ